MNNLKILAFAFVSLLLSCGGVKNNECKIEAEFSGLKSDTIFLGYGTEAPFKVDTLLLSDGKLETTLACDSVMGLFIQTNNHEEKNLTAYVLPGTTLRITAEKGDLSSAVLSGNSFYEQLYNAMHFDSELQDQYDAIVESCKRMETEGASEEDIMNKMMTESEKLSALRGEILLKYVREHRDDEAVVSIISPYSENPDFAVYDTLLTDRVKNGVMGGIYKKYLTAYNQMNEKRRFQEALNSGTMDAPDFSLPQMNGEKLALSDLRGQWVMLDFWGSWCYWCMKGMPRIKECYKKYKGKLEILGINTRDDDEKWSKTVEKNEMSWRHVKDDGSVDFGKLYAIEGYPTYVLISPEGKIAAYACGESEEFFNKMDSLIVK